jgi:hypothetical protein
VLTYDSVISASLLSPQRIVVTMLTRKDSVLRNSWVPYFASHSYTHTDTIMTAPVAPAGYPFSLFEARTGPIRNTGVGWPLSRYRSRYFVDTLSNGALTIERTEDEDGFSLVPSANCWKIMPTSPDRYAIVLAYVEDFGQRLQILYTEQGGIPITYSRHEVVYARVSGMKWGNKMRLTKLGVEDRHPAATFRVAPNPANAAVRVSSTAPAQEVALRLTDVSGQEYYRQRGVGHSFVVPVKELASGFYFLELRTAGGIEVLKVVVQH